MPITDIITTIVKPSATGTLYNGTPAEQLPITLFVADLVTRMGWDPNQFSVYRDCGNLVFGVGTRERNHFCCIQDYSYAYQVKLVMDTLDLHGMFI